MMRNLTKIAGGVLILAATLVVTPATAKPPPAGVWLQLHFTSAAGKTRTITEPVQIVRADYAATECGPDLQRKADGFVRMETAKHPELAGMKFTGANCATDKSGKIKIAVGAWPAGGK